MRSKAPADKYRKPDRDERGERGFHDECKGKVVPPSALADAAQEKIACLADGRMLAKEADAEGLREQAMRRREIHNAIDRPGEWFIGLELHRRV